MEAKQRSELSQPVGMELSNGQQKASWSSTNNEFSDRLKQIIEKMARQGINLTAEDIEGLQSYLASEQQWKEVYRRLANS